MMRHCRSGTGIDTRTVKIENAILQVLTHLREGDPSGCRL